MDFGFLDWLRRAPTGERLRAERVREDLVEAADRAAFGRPCDGEIAALATLLSDDEIVQQLVEGRLGKPAGLLALTSRRLLFVAEGMDPGSAWIVDRAEVLNASAQVQRGLGTLTLTTRSGDVVVDQILGTQARTFAETTAQAPAEHRPSADPLAELAELRARHQAGDVTDAEFKRRKSELLDRI